MNLSLLGEKNSVAKLDAEKVRAMRAAWTPKSRGRRKHEGPSIKEIAAQNGITYYAARSALLGLVPGECETPIDDASPHPSVAELIAEALTGAQARAVALEFLRAIEAFDGTPDVRKLAHDLKSATATAVHMARTAE